MAGTTYKPGRRLKEKPSKKSSTKKVMLSNPAGEAPSGD
jgi:hypothetical protein